MSRRSASLLLAIAGILAACGQASSWQAVAPVANSGGIQIHLLSATTDDHSEPWRAAPAGWQCLVLQIEARSTDGGRHELRPDQFEVAGKRPIDAVGYCNSPQIEPTWVSPGKGEMLTLTVLIAFDSTPQLMWRSP